MITFILILLFGLFLLNVPIAFAIIATSVTFLYLTDVPLVMQIQRMVAASNNSANGMVTSARSSRSSEE